jgi:hypothetical protein
MLGNTLMKKRGKYSDNSCKVAKNDLLRMKKDIDVKKY